MDFVIPPFGEKDFLNTKINFWSVLVSIRIKKWVTKFQNSECQLAGGGQIGQKPTFWRKKFKTLP